MNLLHRSALICVTALVTGCASVSLGDKSTEELLKRLQPIPEKVSLYVCREAGFAGAGLGATVMVNDVELATLGQNTFAHTVVPAGKHELYVVREGFVIGSRNSGVLPVEAKAGDVKVIWVGMTGGGFGVLTLDNFNSQTEANRCVREATYAVKRGK